MYMYVWLSLHSRCDVYAYTFLRNEESTHIQKDLLECGLRDGIVEYHLSDALIPLNHFEERHNLGVPAWMSRFKADAVKENIVQLQLET